MGGFADDCPDCPTTKTATLVNPDNSSTRYTFGIRYYIDEGKMTRMERFSAAGTKLQDVSDSYALTPTSPPYPYVVGSSGLMNADDFAETRLVPMTQSVMAQNGDTFTTTVNSFDAYARPLSMTESNSLGLSRTNTVAYYDDTTRWVMGQTASMTNTNTGKVLMSMDYDATTALPIRAYKFGLLQMSMTYNADGTVATMANGLGQTVRLGNWKLGAPQLITNPDNSTRSAVVDNNGWVTSVTDERGSTTSYTYDLLGRALTQSYPTADSVVWTPQSYSYTQLTASELGVPAGAWRVRMTQGRHQLSMYLDARYNPILDEDRDLTSGINRYTRRSYDWRGMTTFSSYPSTSSSATAGTNTYYDDLGRMTQAQTTDGITLMQLAYLSGNQMQVTDADGKRVTTRYQAFGSPAYDNALVISAPEGQTTTIARDVLGMMQSVTQSGLYSGGTVSVTRTYAYDAYNRVCRRYDPELGNTLIGYDAASRMIWEARGQSSGACVSSAPVGANTMSYDNRGRPTLLHYGDNSGDVSYGYDVAGNRLSVTNPTATWTYSYNKRNLLERETAQIDGNSYSLITAYNALGQTNSQTYPDNRAIALSPDAFGRPTQLGGYVTAVAYHPSGPLASYTMGNQVRYSQTLDSLQRVFEQKLTGTAGTLQDLQYRYTNGGDLTSLTDLVDGADSASFTYDDLHRLKTANGIWGNYGYAYDPLNNLRSRTGGAGAVTYTYDVLNRLGGVSGAVGRSYSYNSRGAVIGDGARTFSVNASDQITVIGAIRYGYDGNGKRIKTTKADGSIEYTLYDASGRLYASIRPAASQTTDYIGDRSQTMVELTNGVATYLHADQLGSPRMATSSTQAILWREHFDPYGQKQNGTSEKIGYTGHAYDADTGLTYAQARFYDPQVGRFLSNDPVGFTGNPYSFNRYSYGNNNPYANIDPTGMASEPSEESEPVTGTRIAGGGFSQHLSSFAGPAASSPGPSGNSGQQANSGGLSSEPTHLGATNDAIQPVYPEAAVIGIIRVLNTIVNILSAPTAAEVETAGDAARGGAQITADGIRATNRALGGATELTGNAETVIANMAYREGAGAQAATAIRDIAGRHLFNDANKRTAQAIAEQILGPGANPAQIRSVIDRVATGDLRSVEDIAAALGH